jgi:3-oxoadipate enol-lactonase
MINYHHSNFMYTNTTKRIKSADGTELYYEVWSAGDVPPQIMFVHGIGGDVDGWQFVRDIITAHGISAVAFDLRGHGYSDHPTRAAAYAIERVEEDIHAVIQAEKLQKPVLIGHSGGAVVSAAYAASYSHLLGGLVLIAGSYCPPAYLQNSLLRAIANGVISVGAFISPPPLKRWHSPYPVGKHHKEVELYGLLRTCVYNSFRSYLYTSRELVNLDLSDALQKISVPTLLIAGEKDGIFPLSISGEMHRRIPHSTLTVLPNTNHVSILNNPSGVSDAILSFIKTL